jgi:lysyl-tRNA synthetase class II
MSKNILVMVIISIFFLSLFTFYRTIDMSLSEHEHRLSKRQQLIDLGIPPYAPYYHKKQTIKELIDTNRDDLRSIEEIIAAPRDLYATAGRLMLKRVSGKLSFAQLQDES